MIEYKDYQHFSVQKLGFSSSRVTMDLLYFNPNNFGLQLSRSELDIFIDNTFLGHSTSDTLIQIPRHSDFVIPIRFDADMKNVFKNAWNTLFDKEVLVSVTGHVKVVKANVFMSMPVNYEGKQKFSFF